MDQTPIRTKPEKESYVSIINRKIVGHELDIEYHKLMLQKLKHMLELRANVLEYVEKDVWSHEDTNLYNRKSTELLNSTEALDDAIRLSRASVKLHHDACPDSDDDY